MTNEQPIEQALQLDPFEQELRRILAVEATGPAPERLVARVAAIPRAVRPRVALVDRVPGRLGSGEPSGWAAGWPRSPRWS